MNGNIFFFIRICWNKVKCKRLVFRAEMDFVIGENNVWIENNNV